MAEKRKLRSNSGNKEKGNQPPLPTDEPEPTEAPPLPPGPPADSTTGTAAPSVPLPGSSESHNPPLPTHVSNPSKEWLDLGSGSGGQSQLLDTNTGQPLVKKPRLALPSDDPANTSVSSETEPLPSEQDLSKNLAMNIEVANAMLAAIANEINGSSPESIGDADFFSDFGEPVMSSQPEPFEIPKLDCFEDISPCVSPTKLIGTVTFGIDDSAESHGNVVSQAIKIEPESSSTTGLGSNSQESPAEVPTETQFTKIKENKAKSETVFTSIKPCTKAQTTASIEQDNPNSDVPSTSEVQSAVPQSNDSSSNQGNPVPEAMETSPEIKEDSSEAPGGPSDIKPSKEDLSQKVIESKNTSQKQAESPKPDEVQVKMEVDGDQADNPQGNTENPQENMEDQSESENPEPDRSADARGFCPFDVGVARKPASQIPIELTEDAKGNSFVYTKC